MTHFRCPRTKIMVSQVICEGRKTRKEHGCVTCGHPRDVARDEARMAGLRVRLNLEPKRASERANPIEIRGLAQGTIQLSRLVARDLVTKLEAALSGWRA